MFLKFIYPINNDLTAKVSGFTETTYSAVTGLAYDSTNKKLGLKVGADTVIPFSGKELIYLGTISGDSTMNIKTKYPNEYANFTTSNFICERSTGGSNNYGGVGYNYLEVPTFSKSYSSSTGILSVSGNRAGIGLGSSVYQSISTTVKVYLVK